MEQGAGAPAAAAAVLAAGSYLASGLWPRQRFELLLFCSIAVVASVVVVVVVVVVAVVIIALLPSCIKCRCHSLSATPFPLLPPAAAAAAVSYKCVLPPLRYFSLQHLSLSFAFFRVCAGKTLHIIIKWLREFLSRAPWLMQ